MSFYKRGIPVLWNGAILMFAIIIIKNGIAQNQIGQIGFMLFVTAMLAFIGFIVMKYYIFDLVDEVWDLGDSLLVKNHGHEETVPIRDIAHVSYNGVVNPPQVTVVLRRSIGNLGRQFVFTPPFRIMPYSMPPIAMDLLDRIERPI
jgi:hypothetical protein